LEQVEQLQDGSSSTLEKALKMADEAGEKEQEKVAALQMEERPDVPDDWKWLSEADKDDLKNDLDHIDDWGLSR
jgi:hypothetical protein